jgi:hypothetical protein
MKKLLLGLALMLTACGDQHTGNESEAALKNQAHALSEAADQAVNLQINAIEAANPPPINVQQASPPASADEAPTK